MGFLIRMKGDEDTLGHLGRFGPLFSFDLMGELPYMRIPGQLWTVRQTPITAHPHVILHKYNPILHSLKQCVSLSLLSRPA